MRTPLLNFPILDERLGARVFLKAETMQRMGAFKFRGAYNKISSIPADKRAAGVVAFSSGNHAQGVAAAAKLLGVPAVIVMPSDAPMLKRERTASLGAEVVLYDRDTEDREAIARAIAEKKGAMLVPPYDDPLIIAGQGTLGREIVEDLDKLNLKPEMVVVGASGGGLAAGTALGIKAAVPDADIWTAEPEGFDDTLRSFKSGKRESNARMSGTICDALMTHIPGEITFAINSKLIGKGVSAQRRGNCARRRVRVQGIEARGRARRRHRPCGLARGQARRQRQDRGRDPLRRQYRSGSALQIARGVRPNRPS